jgi:hypothetical protein
MARSIPSIGLLAAIVLLAPVAAHAVPMPTHSERVGPVLLQMLDAYDRGGEAGLRGLAAARRIRLRESTQGVLLPVILEPRAGLSPQEIDPRAIEALGGRVDAVSESFLRVLVSPRDAARLADLEDVSVVRAPTIATEVAGFGSIVSESVALTGAATFQNQGFVASGAKVAVVDLGFQGLSNLISLGELPANTITMDFTGSGIESTTQHGAAVSEEVMDMAPGAQLYCLKIGDEVDLQNAAAYLRTNGIHIANHSVAWVLASYYDDTGPINTIINASHDNDGVFWSVASGNFAQQHWRGKWSGDGQGRLFFAPNQTALNLGLVDGTITLFLNWNQYGNSVTNLDLYVFDRNGTVAASSTGLQNGPQAPSESVSFSYNSSLAPYTAEVLWVSGPTNGLDVTLFSFDNTLGPATASSSMMDPADAHGAVAVGAIPESNYAAASPALESYSSLGPTTDGRTKPDFCAPDGTSTHTYGTLSSYGTSFSAPVVAGGAALWQQAAGIEVPGMLLRSLAGFTSPLGTNGPNTLCGNGKFIAWRGGDCGLGGELVFVLPPLLWLRNRRRAGRRERSAQAPVASR